MKMIVLVLALLISPPLFANGLMEIGEKDRCPEWVRNAMYGATQSMRGASREVEFISGNRLVELLAPVGEAGTEKLYILAIDGQTEFERRFLEESILFGYDAMSGWEAYSAGRTPERAEWRQRFMAMCLAYVAI